MNAILQDDRFLTVRARIREKKLVRVLCYPFLAPRNVIQERKFWQSEDCVYLQGLKDTQVGKRCFIIGNGPSLVPEDLDALVGEHCFAANRIYKLFDQTEWRPTYLLAFDKDIVEKEADKLASLSLPCIFLDKVAKKRCGDVGDNVHFFNKDRHFHIRQHSLNHVYYSEDVSRRVCGGGTVTYAAMQMALYMGYKEIYLVGIDHTYTHIVDSRGKVTVRGGFSNHCYEEAPNTYYNYQYLEGTEYAYLVAMMAAEQHGARIMNATRGGALEVFERVDLDEVLARIEEER